jgi:2-keto-4-pentenoate hydratase/2-oxohepta-3-ene-1,7-dioic acid hydratase in catechol pathway
MKLARFNWQGKPTHGVVDRDEIRSVTGNIFDRFEVGGTLCKASEVRFLTATDPNNLMAVGLNYVRVLEEYKKKSGREIDKPMIFTLTRSSIAGPLDNVIYPQLTKDLWAYGELVVVIKKPTRLVSESEAGDYILGYTCGNDLAALDIEFGEDDGRTDRAHNFDTFSVFGPVIDTDIAGDNLEITLKVNGEVRTRGYTREMAFNTRRVVSHISQFMTLGPGDVIFMGSPEGYPVVVGDSIEVEIEGIGKLYNEVVGP